VGSHSAQEKNGPTMTTPDERRAQAFKRACSCFGLGRYFYHFTGTWVELDDRKRPKSVPKTGRLGNV